MKKILLYILLTAITFEVYAQRQKYQINGAARSYIFANNLDISNDLDSITTRKANYGHTLLDFGVSAYPNEKTEVIGMFRIRNELGGFWGGGVSFNVRQLTVKGVAGNLVRYELGDIDVKMTPYTLYNNIEEGVVNEADAFALRREIVHYDMFYNDDNSWRMQGGRAQFGLEFGKYLKGVDFDAFITRQRATDGISNPERLYGGGTVTINQSDDISIGLNSINLFDLTETTTDSVKFTNSVNTFNWKYNYNIDSTLSVGIKGEGGMSTVQYENYDESAAPEKYDDTFLDVALTSTLKEYKTTLSFGFKDVGPDFLSAGAQTKRINFSKYPALYQQYTNDFIARDINYFDFISANTENSYKISETLMTYNAAYGNITPYGIATANRRGMYLNATREDTSKFTKTFIEVAYLNQIRGTGTFELKNFMLVRAGTDVFWNDYIGWKKAIKTDLGIQLEKTTRGGEEFEKVDLSSLLLDAGLTVEFLPQLEVLLGAKVWTINGNEYFTERNSYNTVVNYFDVEYNLSQNTYAAGLRYNFSETTALSAQYQMFQLKDNTENGIDYGISQFNILYNMFF